MPRGTSLCLSCISLEERPPFGARRCAVGRSIVLNADPLSCPAYSPTVEPVQHPDQLDLFCRLTAEPHAEVAA